jgi:cardiolipin synthase
MRSQAPAWLNLPNLLSAARLASAPFIVAAIIGGKPKLALLLFFAAAVTDSVDGMLARRLHAATRTGAYLDPLADKVFLCAVILALWIAGSAPAWYAAVVFGRDLLILAFATTALAVTRYRRFSPSRWGKASTLLQIVTVVSLLVCDLAPSPLVAGFSWAALRLSAAITLWSGIHYAWRAFLGEERQPD